MSQNKNARSAVAKASIRNSRPAVGEVTSPPTPVDAVATPIGVAKAAAMLGVTTERVRQLDAELQPIRVGHGFRIYDPARVAQFAKARLEKQRP